MSVSPSLCHKVFGHRTEVQTRSNRKTSVNLFSGGERQVHFIYMQCLHWKRAAKKQSASGLNAYRPCIFIKIINAYWSQISHCHAQDTDMVDAFSFY